MENLYHLRNLVLAPYIIKATALIGVERRIGGNQFRHCFCTLGILLDYKYFNDSVLLKAAIIHDLYEDLPFTNLNEIRNIDSDGYEVVDLMLEVSRRDYEQKTEYLERLLHHGSRRALLIKCCDRISNLTDLHPDTDSIKKIKDYLVQTENYVLPMAAKVDENMVKEIEDLILRRRRVIAALMRD